MGYLFDFFLFWSRISLCSPAWLPWNSLCRPGWPQTHRFACLCLPSAGIKGMWRCIWLWVTSWHKHTPTCLHMTLSRYGKPTQSTGSWVAPQGSREASNRTQRLKRHREYSLLSPSFCWQLSRFLVERFTNWFVNREVPRAWTDQRVRTAGDTPREPGI